MSTVSMQQNDKNCIRKWLPQHTENNISLASLTLPMLGANRTAQEKICAPRCACMEPGHGFHFILFCCFVSFLDLLTPINPKRKKCLPLSNSDCPLSNCCLLIACVYKPAFVRSLSKLLPITKIIYTGKECMCFHPIPGCICAQRVSSNLLICEWGKRETKST